MRVVVTELSLNQVEDESFDNGECVCVFIECGGSIVLKLSVKMNFSRKIWINCERRAETDSSEQFRTDTPWMATNAPEEFSM